MLHAGWCRPGAQALQLRLAQGTAAAFRSSGRTVISTTVVAGLKKKHKPKAKKPAAKGPEVVAEAAPQKPARRIDTAQINIKTWKRLIKKHKQAQAPPAEPQRGFRKTKVEDEKRLAREAEREAAYQAVRKKKSDGASFASLYGSKGDNKPAVLLVDGYNVLGRAAGIKPDDGDEQVAAALTVAFGDGRREALQNRLCEYSHLRQIKVVLVFDALGGGSGIVTRTTARGAIDIVYCGDSEADTFIMLEVTALKEKGTPQVLVATSDQDLTTSIAGAHVVSAAALLREIGKAEKEATARMRASQLTPWRERPGIGENVLSKDPALYQKLQEMRAGRFN